MFHEIKKRERKRENPYKHPKRNVKYISVDKIIFKTS